MNNNRKQDFDLDALDIELFEVEKRRFLNFVPAPGSWAAQIPADPFLV